MFSSKIVSPPTFSFHTIVDNSKCTLCSYNKTCTVLSIIWLCSYVAALLESLSHFTQHITSDGTKYLFLTIAEFGAYLLFSTYSFIWDVTTQVLKIWWKDTEHSNSFHLIYFSMFLWLETTIVISLRTLASKQCKF